MRPNFTLPRRWFPPELRTASALPRWSIVWTLTRDTLSNHSFFVAVYSNQIARMIDWQGDFGALLFTALTDDLEETITGDLPSPAKREILDGQRATAYIDIQMARRLETIVAQQKNLKELDWQYGEIVSIVKAADRLDALLFLTIERRMGNSVVVPRIQELLNKLEGVWRALPASEAVLDRLWNTEVIPALHEHESTGGYGL